VKGIYFNANVNDTSNYFIGAAMKSVKITTFQDIEYHRLILEKSLYLVNLVPLSIEADLIN